MELINSQIFYYFARCRECGIKAYTSEILDRYCPCCGNPMEMKNLPSPVKKNFVYVEHEKITEMQISAQKIQEEHDILRSIGMINNDFNKKGGEQ